MTITQRFFLVLLACACAAPAAVAQAENDATVEQLTQRIHELEVRVAELEALILPMREKLETDARRAALRERFNARMKQDRSTYTPEELREIERIYQVANKQWKSPEAKQSLELLIGKYAGANRTACAMLYLGQMTQGPQREKYLKTAIENHGDGMYGDGVQVGAYARFHLAMHYRRAGRNEEADALFNEIREQFPRSIDHRGRLLVDLMPG